MAVRLCVLKSTQAIFELLAICKRHWSHAEFVYMLLMRSPVKFVLQNVLWHIRLLITVRSNMTGH